MKIQEINVSGGAAEYTWPATVTETGGKDISGDAVQISLGTWDAPGVWKTAVLDHPTPSTVTAKTLIDSSVTPGVYFVRVKITDAPESVPRRVLAVRVT